MLLVANNTVVTLNYNLTDSDGEAIETNATLAYLHGGYEGIFPKVEEGLVGKSVGGEFAISLEPEDGFGDYDENLIRMEPASVFPANVEVGMQFEGVPPGEDDDRWIIYTVTDIADGQVVVDGNHPLAGERLIFKCTISDIRAATPEEISHGHPHGEHGVNHH
jgi:FKBP-type peptidyl-prolyl cis-trans isomerase SlyD